MNSAFSFRDLDHPGDKRLRLLIEASAGTGKTYTLERLVVYYIVRHGFDLNSILVVTFTRKATRELRNRIRSLLVKLLADADFARELLAEIGLANLGESAWEKPVKNQLRLFQQAEIHTIHGFAKSILDRYPAESGSLRELRIDNGSLSQIIRDEVLATLVNGRLPLVWQIVISTDPISAPHILQGADLDFCLDQAFEIFKCKSAADLLWLLEKQSNGGLFDPQQYQFGLAPGTDPEELWNCLYHRHWTLVKTIVANDSAVDADIADMYRALEGLQPGLHMHKKADLADSLSRICAYSLARWLVLGLGSYKQRQVRYLDVISHNVLLKRLDQATPEGSLLLDELRFQYRLVLIDEFQDTDRLQWRIFSRLAAHGDLIVVGDPKQAIYGFRGADLNTYLQARRELGQLRILDSNFRSSQPLIGSFNTMFEACLNSENATGDLQ